TGLGLTITKRLLNLMDGEIFVKSEPGQGSEFHIEINDIEMASTNTKKSDTTDFTDLNNIEFQEATILLVDDVQFNRELVLAYLDFDQISILEAVNGEEAINQARLFHPDLILMDLKMPVMDGITASRHLKNDEETKDIPIVILSASVMKDTVKEVKGISDGLLKKPISYESLIEELRHHLKYEILEEKVPEIPEENETITHPLDFALAEKLLNYIDSEMQDEWKKHLEICDFGEISEFAEKIASQSKEHRCLLLEKWARNLASCVEMFDVDSINKHLKDFPEVIATLKDQLKSG
ncbi:MAG: response regulator, partial [Spirochaetota bacterium]|nr:response regulator [Spirochaetota bacterium]